jgi:oligogalacturonide transport system ATP-binding protein
MGSEVFVHAEIGGLPFTGRVPPDALGELAGKSRGDEHVFHAQLQCCHLFDADSGVNLLA